MFSPCQSRGYFRTGFAIVGGALSGTYPRPSAPIPPISLGTGVPFRRGALCIGLIWLGNPTRQRLEPALYLRGASVWSIEIRIPFSYVGPITFFSCEGILLYIGGALILPLSKAITKTPFLQLSHHQCIPREAVSSVDVDDNCFVSYAIDFRFISVCNSVWMYCIQSIDFSTESFGAFTELH